MPKFMIEYSDYQKLIEMAKQNPSSTDELDIIINKYSISKLINEIKVKLFNDVKRHKQGTPENKKAYDKYNAFKYFSDNLKESVDEKDITIDVLVKSINEYEIRLESLGIQDRLNINTANYKRNEIYSKLHYGIELFCDPKNCVIYLDVPSHMIDYHIEKLSCIDLNYVYD